MEKPSSNTLYVRFCSGAEKAAASLVFDPGRDLVLVKRVSPLLTNTEASSIAADLLKLLKKCVPAERHRDCYSGVFRHRHEVEAGYHAPL